jgi:hypothetical protein
VARPHLPAPAPDPAKGARVTALPLFPDNYYCPGGCGGSGYLLETDDGWLDPCLECNPDGERTYDPWLAPIPF